MCSYLTKMHNSCTFSMLRPRALLLLAIVLATAFQNSNGQSSSDDDIIFQKWDETETYNSTTNFNHHGMGAIYNATNKVLYSFAGDKPIPPGFLEINGTNIMAGPKAINGEWSELLNQYWGLLTVCVIGIILILLMPIIGLCFCCCRCCGNCGSEQLYYQEYQDTPRQIYFCLLVVLSVGLAFGVVVAFASNTYMRQGIVESTKTVQLAVDDLMAYLTSSSKNILFILDNNFDDLVNYINKNINDMQSNIETNITDKLNNIFTDTFQNTLTILNDTVKDLKEINVKKNKLTDNFKQFIQKLNEIEDKLKNLKEECKNRCNNIAQCNEKCEQLNVNGLENFDPEMFEKLPKLESKIDEAEKFIDKINSGELMEKAREEISKIISATNKTRSEAIEKIKNELKKFSDIVDKNFDGITGDVHNYTEKALNNADGYINDYNVYIMAVGITICVILLIIWCLILCGLIIAPWNRAADASNKRFASKLFLIAIVLIFMTIWFYALLSLIHFLVGLVLQRGLCVPLQNPKTDQIFGYIDQLIDLNTLFNQNNAGTGTKGSNNKNPKQNSEPYRISDILENCRNNQPIYEALKLKNVYDVDKIKEFIEKQDFISKISELIDELNKQSGQIIPEENIEELVKKLKESIPEIDNKDFEKWKNDNDIESLNLDQAIENLKKVAEELGNPMEEEIQKIIEDLKKLQKSAKNIINDTKNLIDSMEIFVVTFNDNKEKISKEIDGLREKRKELIDFIADFIKKDGQTLVKKLTDSVSAYVNMALKSTKSEIGKCQPIATIFDAFVVAICPKFISPTNTFGIALGWSVLMFLPMLIFALKLSSLYNMKYLPITNINIYGPASIGLEKLTRITEKLDTNSLTRRNSSSKLNNAIGKKNLKPKLKLKNPVRIFATYEIPSESDFTEYKEGTEFKDIYKRRRESHNSIMYETPLEFTGKETTEQFMNLSQAKQFSPRIIENGVVQFDQIGMNTNLRRLSQQSFQSKGEQHYFQPLESINDTFPNDDFEIPPPPPPIVEMESEASELALDANFQFINDPSTLQIDNISPIKFETLNDKSDFELEFGSQHEYEHISPFVISSIGNEEYAFENMENISPASFKEDQISNSYFVKSPSPMYDDYTERNREDADPFGTVICIRTASSSAPGNFKKTKPTPKNFRTFSIKKPSIDG